MTPDRTALLMVGGWQERGGGGGEYISFMALTSAEEGPVTHGQRMNDRRKTSTIFLWKLLPPTFLFLSTNARTMEWPGAAREWCQRQSTSIT